MFHLSNVHKLPVFVQHGPRLLSIIAQSDMSLQQGVQQLPKPLHCLNTHTHTNHHLINTGSVVVYFCGVVDVVCPTCKASSSHLNSWTICSIFSLLTSTMSSHLQHTHTVKGFFHSHCYRPLMAALFIASLMWKEVKRQKNKTSPLLTELHLLHDSLDVLNVVLLFSSWTLGFVQRPRLLAAHLLQQQRPLLTQRSQTCLCKERRRRLVTQRKLDYTHHLIFRKNVQDLSLRARTDSLQLLLQQF